MYSYLCFCLIIIKKKSQSHIQLRHLFRLLSETSTAGRPASCLGRPRRGQTRPRRLTCYLMPAASAFRPSLSIAIIQRQRATAAATIQVSTSSPWRSFTTPRQLLALLFFTRHISIMLSQILLFFTNHF